MANINYSTASGATAAGSYSCPYGTPTNTGAVGNIRDGNGATFDGYIGYNPNGVVISMTNSVTFASTVSSIVAVTCIGSWGANVAGSCSMYLDLYYSAGWHQVSSLNASSGGSFTIPFIITASGSWNNVGQVRWRSSGTGYGPPPPLPPAVIAFYDHELEAYGPTLVDSGIRFVCGGTNVSIGAEPVTATHALRVQNDSTTLGIPFVSVTAGNATAIRIYDGASVQSIPKI